MSQVSPHCSPIVQRGRQTKNNVRRTGLDLHPHICRCQCRDVKTELAELDGIGAFGDRPVGIIGLGRADIDQLIQQHSVGLRRSRCRLGEVLLGRDPREQILDLGPQGEIHGRLQQARCPSAAAMPVQQRGR